MVNAQCPIQGCDFQTGEFPAVVVAQLLSTHTTVAHTVAAPAAPQAAHRRAPKVDRPALSDSIEEETWNEFEQNWRIFVRANDVQEADQVVQLYSCCTNSLKSKITAVHHNFLERPIQELLPLLKALAVVPVARTVKQNEFLQMKQDPGETIRAFHSRVKAKARTCHFKTNCIHPHAPLHEGEDPPARVEVDYSNEMIRHVVLNGLYDDDIRRDIFGNERIDVVEVDELISIIEGKETARDATSSSASALSLYRRNKRGKNKDHHEKSDCVITQQQLNRKVFVVQ